MMEFYVSGQSLKLFSPAVAADSLNYLGAKLHFTDSEWDGASKWLHFRSGERVYDVQLDEDDCISPDKGVNLTIGQWEIYLTGTRGDSRLTTLPVILTVHASGLIDAPLHELPMSVAEQVDYNAALALRFAQEVKADAEAGKFNGRDGTSFSPLGYFENTGELEAAELSPQPGDVYAVGSAAPYELYVWDGLSLRWINNGSIQGPQGQPGRDGATYIPAVDSNGNISWSNDGGLANPLTRNIMGPKGADGAVGPPGPGAFEKAREAGYTGTEETFYAALSYMPYHNRRHLPDGADPLIVSAAALADDARSFGVAVALPASGWSDNVQTVAVERVTAGNNVLVSAAPASREAWNDAEIYCSAQAEGTLTFTCVTVPTADITANVVVLV